MPYFHGVRQHPVAYSDMKIARRKAQDALSARLSAIMESAKEGNLGQDHLKPIEDMESRLLSHIADLPEYTEGTKASFLAGYSAINSGIDALSWHVAFMCATERQRYPL